MKRKYLGWLGAAIFAWVMGALFLFFVSMASASPLEDWTKGYKAGTSFAEYGDYQRLYATTADRDFVVMRQKQEGDVISVEYLASWTDLATDAREAEHGYAAFYLIDGLVYTEEHVPIHKSVDMALAGQAADIASTALGLSQGFVEANPIGGTPAGLGVLVALKLAGPSIADRMDLPSCIALRQGLASFGFGAAAWNLGLLIAPAVGIVGAIVAYTMTDDRKPALRACVEARL